MSELGIEEALAHVLDGASALTSEDVPLEGALGRVLSQPVIAPRDLPPYDGSAMDGYAARAADLPGTLAVVGEIPAGHEPARALGPGEAMRIFTGAMLPDGADVVVMQEEAVAQGPSVVLGRAATAGEHVRRAGEDIARGTPSLSQGTSIDIGELGLLVSLGITHVAVHRRPRVTIVATGDELVPLGVAPGPTQIVEANGWMLAALIERAGGIAVRAPIVRDTPEAVEAALTEAARTSDLVITCGGVSVGDYDFVQKVLGAHGALAFWKVRMKPGKPLAFGHFAGTPLLGLPGNPVSAFVTCVMFGCPLVRTLAGRRDVQPRRQKVSLGSDLRPNKSRRELLRASLSPNGVATPLPRQDSHLLTSLVGAQVLLDVAPGATTLPAGHELEAVFI